MADGPVVNVPGRYTHCVDRADYKPLETGAGSVLFKIGAASFGKAFCDYLLGGKLVCLGPSECALGHVVRDRVARDDAGHDYPLAG